MLEFPNPEAPSLMIEPVSRFHGLEVVHFIVGDQHAVLAKVPGLWNAGFEPGNPGIFQEREVPGVVDVSKQIHVAVSHGNLKINGRTERFKGLIHRI